MNHILDRIREVVISTGLNDSEFARQAGIAQSTFANMFSRGSEPRAEVLSKIVINFKVDANWLLTGKGSMFIEEVTESPAAVQAKIPLLRQTIAASPGTGWNDTDIVEKFIEPVALLPSFSSLYAFQMCDTSMAGAGIEEGDIILFDAASACHTDDLYVFALNGTVYCKLLKFDTIRKTIKIYSLHTPAIKHAEELRTLSTASPEGQEILHIFGKVVAWLRGNRLITR